MHESSPDRLAIVLSPMRTSAFSSEGGGESSLLALCRSEPTTGWGRQKVFTIAGTVSTMLASLRKRTATAYTLSQ